MKRRLTKKLEGKKFQANKKTIRMLKRKKIKVDIDENSTLVDNIVLIDDDRYLNIFFLGG